MQKAIQASVSLRDVEPVKTFINELADLRNRLTAGQVDGDGLREAMDCAFKRLYGGFGKPEDYGIGLTIEAPAVRRVPVEDVERLTLTHWPALKAWPTVGIVIPAYNAPGLLRQALEGIERTTYNAEVQVCVVDNGSIPPIEDQFPKNLKPLFVERLDEPTSFAAAVNHGMDTIMGWRDVEYLVLFNQDIQVTDPNWLTNLINWMEQRPRCAVAGAKLLYLNGTVQHAGIEIPVGSCGRHTSRGMKAVDPTVAQYQQVQGVTGAVFCIRRTALLELGMLDEAYPWTCEDLDYCLRASINGWEVWYVADSVLIHEEGAVGKVDPEWHSTLREKMNASAHRFRKVWGPFVDLAAAGHIAIVVAEWKPDNGYCRLASIMASGFQNAGLNVTIYSHAGETLDADGLRIRPLAALKEASVLIATRFDTVLLTKQIRAKRKFYMIDAMVNTGGQYRTESEQALLASYYQMEYELIAGSAEVATALETMGRTATVVEHDVRRYLQIMCGVPV
jgi:GT2 family glycosyltransferase